MQYFAITYLATAPVSLGSLLFAGLRVDQYHCEPESRKQALRGSGVGEGVSQYWRKKGLLPYKRQLPFNPLKRFTIPDANVLPDGC